jgi:hypothetical protein
MRPVEGSFVVHDDGDVLEVLARAAGPAGARGVELLDGLVSIDLDGADVDQLVAVRLVLSGRSLTAEQLAFLERFFGSLAPAVSGALGASRPVRVGASRRALSSLRGVRVDPSLALAVGGLDEFLRSPSPAPVEAVLALSSLLGIEELGLVLPDALRRRLRDRLDELPRSLAALLLTGGVAGGVAGGVTGVLLEAVDGEYAELLARATRAGVLLGLPPLPDRAVFGPESRPAATVPVFSKAEHSFAAFGPEGLVGEGRGVTGPAGRPLVLDPASLVRDGVSWFWRDGGSLEVSVASVSADEGLWVRVRSEDGVLLAASPLGVPVSGSRSALLLVGAGPGLVLDVVSSVSARVHDGRVVASARAAAAGRRAGRLERLGDGDEAMLAWEECAAWHRVAGDAPREKLAIGRAASSMSSGSDVDGMRVLDAVLLRERA